MNPSRLPLLAAGIALTAFFAFATGNASACPGQEGGCACAKAAAAAQDSAGANHDSNKACACAPGEGGKCACGADCPSNHGGECSHGKAAASEAPKNGACGSCGACGGGAAAPADANLKAAIDPATGQFVEPEDDAAPAALATGDGEPVREVRQPGGGVMVAAPAELAPKAVATIDDSGKAHTGCAE